MVLYVNECDCVVWLLPNKNDLRCPVTIQNGDKFYYYKDGSSLFNGVIEASLQMIGLLRRHQFSVIDLCHIIPSKIFVSQGALDITCHGCKASFVLATYLGKCPECGGVHAVAPMNPVAENVQFAGADFTL